MLARADAGPGSDQRQRRLRQRAGSAARPAPLKPITLVSSLIAVVIGGPLAVLIPGLAVLVLAGDLLAMLPAGLAARTRPAAELRTE